MIARFGPGATTFRPYIHKLRGVKALRFTEMFLSETMFILRMNILKLLKFMMEQESLCVLP